MKKFLIDFEFTGTREIEADSIGEAEDIFWSDWENYREEKKGDFIAIETHEKWEPKN